MLASVGASVFPVAGCGPHQVVLAAAAYITMRWSWSSGALTRERSRKQEGNDRCNATVMTRRPQALPRRQLAGLHKRFCACNCDPDAEIIMLKVTGVDSIC